MAQTLKNIKITENTCTVYSKSKRNSPQTHLHTYFRFCSVVLPNVLYRLLNILCNELLRSSLSSFFVEFTRTSVDEDIKSGFTWSTVKIPTASYRDRQWVVKNQPKGHRRSIRFVGWRADHVLTRDYEPRRSRLVPGFNKLLDGIIQIPRRAMTFPA